tara:strand:- start:331 stop:1011 length:681 start_codon:yes stop_codon:yes gene_type:complete
MEEIKDGRYERKFVFSELGLKEVERIIKSNLGMFSEIFEERRVNNIYLDSVGMEDFIDNVDGNPKRLKMRIRWYGSLFGKIESPVLEIKMKENLVGRKIDFALKGFVLDKDFSMKILEKVFENSELPDWVIERLKLRQPTLLNSYKRRYFISSDKRQRITLDWDLIFFNIGRNNVFMRGIRDKEVVILELKYDNKEEERVRWITQDFPFRMTKSSKYVRGIELLSD